MAIVKLTNEQIQTVVNQAYQQMTGQESVETAIDLSKFSDTGTADPTAAREQFTGALIGVLTKNWFTDTSYRSTENDIFFEDSQRFGAITQAISVTVPEVQENPAWQTFVSGTTTVGQYTVYLPVVDARYYVKSESWALPITISGEQWDTAFRDETELYGFVGYVFMMVDNALTQHLEDLNAANRNHFIAEKLAYAATSDAKGVQAINLPKAYCESRGITKGMTVAEFMTNDDALLYSVEQLSLYKDYLRKQTALFNTAGKVRFTPTERLVVQVLSYFEKRLDTVSRSKLYHDEMVKLPYYRPIPAWQSMNDLSFNGLSSINITTQSGETIEKGGIIALMCDKWAIMHTIRSNRVATQRFDIENLTLYSYQHRDSFMNDLTMNAVVFYVEDVPATDVDDVPDTE